MIKIQYLFFNNLIERKIFIAFDKNHGHKYSENFTKKSEYNPLIIPSDVKPSRKDFQVDGIFNCGVCSYDGEVILACRVAESVHSENKDIVNIPIVINKDGKDIINIISICRSEHPEWDFSDPRIIYQKTVRGRRVVYLTSLSHIRLARSKDGIHFIVDDNPFIMPTAKDESWGMEDPRITPIGDIYYMNYTAVSVNGPATALISTKDFISWRRLGIIFAPENKDVTIFPQKINGMYYALNRPVSGDFGTPDIWLSESPDLKYWGNQHHFYGVSSDDSWENGRIGGGAVPFLTDKGWVVIYHAADRNNRYCLGAFLLAADNPMKILAKTSEPIVEPDKVYEKSGFFHNTVFTCGCNLEGESVIIYYGAADDKICRVDISLSEIYKALGL